MLPFISFPKVHPLVEVKLKVSLEDDGKAMAVHVGSILSTYL